ncbi:MAG: hypothetical protein ACI837_002538 [Crocinitomicaceae bacterium]|jgi:hypothetical protein
MIVEKEVTVTGTGYDQTNFDNMTPGHPYEGAGSPIVGFVHKNVLRKYLGGPWWTAGQIPASVSFGTEASYT